MTLQERLDKLLSEGAVVQLPAAGEPMLTLLLAGARIKRDPSRLRWCAVFPEHQSHVHELEYDKVDVVHDRDLSFTRNGEIVAYVAPYQEAETDLDEIQATLADWRADLAIAANAEEFARFFETA